MVDTPRERPDQLAWLAARGGILRGKPKDNPTTSRPIRELTSPGSDVPIKVDKGEQLVDPEQGEALIGRPETGADGAEAIEGRQDGREPGEQTTVPGEDGSDRGREASQEAAAQARDRVAEGLTDIDSHLNDLALSEVWKEVAEAAGLPLDRLNDVRETVGLLKQSADEMLTAGPGEASSLGLAAVSTAAVIEADLAEIQDAAGSVESDSGSIVSRTLKRVMKILARTARWLLKLISNLLTPKQWSLTGGIEVPGLANASISITFGG